VALAFRPGEREAATYKGTRKQSPKLKNCHVWVTSVKLV
jgi:hypothetical protein